jgi:protein tyrosine phosphatase
MQEPIISGPARRRDVSYSYFSRYPELQELERGILYDQFYPVRLLRNLESEYRILRKITETREHAGYLIDKEFLVTGHNRYSDILPYKDTIVSLSTRNYINASLIDGSTPGSDEMFIATQGPLHCTRNIFWKMIWEYKVQLIVMMCSISESGRVKCDQYFPCELGSSIISEDYEITLTSQRSPFPTIIERQLTIKSFDTLEVRVIKHLQATAWPDHNVPFLEEEYNAINYLIALIKKNRQKYLTGKVAVHCSAGCGRTGILIGLYQMVTSLEWQLSRQQRAQVSVFGTVRRLREQRWGMVNTKEQYMFMYKYIESWITSYLTHIRFMQGTED